MTPAATLPPILLLACRHARGHDVFGAPCPACVSILGAGDNAGALPLAGGYFALSLSFFSLLSSRSLLCSLFLSSLFWLSSLFCLSSLLSLSSLSPNLSYMLAPLYQGPRLMNLLYFQNLFSCREASSSSCRDSHPLVCALAGHSVLFNLKNLLTRAASPMPKVARTHTQDW